MQELSVTQNDTRKTSMNTWRRVALILIVLADAGLLAWGAMAAVAPERSRSCSCATDRRLNIENNNKE